LLASARLLYRRIVRRVAYARQLAVGAVLGVVIAAGSSRPALAVIGEAGVGVGVDLNAGADTLATLQFSDGSTQDIKAGNGLLLTLGGGIILFEQQRHRLEAVLDIGLKYSTMQPSQNADLSFVRVPIELLAFYRNDDAHFRVGAGGAYYPYSSLSGSGAASNLQLDFKPALGAVVEGDFLWGRGYLGIRYTYLSYSVSGSSTSAAASSLGFTLGFSYQFESRPPPPASPP
jgi:hypothetical protein